MIRWLLNSWRGRQRAIDIAILWPSCRETAPTLEDAHAAFTLHTTLDPAWRTLTQDEVDEIVGSLM